MSDRRLDPGVFSHLFALAVLAAAVWFSTWTPEEAARWDLGRTFEAMGGLAGPALAVGAAAVLLGTLAALGWGVSDTRWWHVPTGGAVLVVAACATVAVPVALGWLLLTVSAGTGWVRGLAVGVLLYCLVTQAATIGQLRREAGSMTARVEDQTRALARLEERVGQLSPPASPSGQEQAEPLSGPTDLSKTENP